MSARTGIREPGLTIKHVGPIGAALIATIAVTAGLGLALGIRPAASQGVPVRPRLTSSQFRAGERLPLVRPRLTSSSSGPASDCRSCRPRLTSSSSGPASDCRSCRPRLTSSSSGRRATAAHTLTSARYGRREALQLTIHVQSVAGGDHSSRGRPMSGWMSPRRRGDVPAKLGCDKVPQLACSRSPQARATLAKASSSPRCARITRSGSIPAPLRSSTVGSALARYDPGRAPFDSFFDRDRLRIPIRNVKRPSGACRRAVRCRGSAGAIAPARRYLLRL